MTMPTCTLTTADRVWMDHAIRPAGPEAVPRLTVTDEETIVWRGWGGCFNELGWVALGDLTKEDRGAVLDRLFGPESDLGLTFCRLPIGANDYACDWYSHNEHDGDFAMQRFSIDRDRLHLLPYLREGLRREPGMTLFASPWSPPTWLKRPAVHNHGTLVDDDRYYDAYALYFVRFIEAYAAEGITIHHVHPQNEPISTQKFPSCVMTGAELARFIGRHLGPAFHRAGLTTEIWLGTLNGPETDSRRWWTSYHDYAGLVLEDPDAARHIAGIGYQWAGKYAVQLTRLAHPDLPLIQTENECGCGDNSWAHAWWTADLIQHYLLNDACAYVYWNMVLAPGGESSWGWRQNSLVTVDPTTRQAVTNPEFAVLRHYCRIRPGQSRLRTTGPWTASCLAFRDDDAITLVLRNPHPHDHRLTIALPCGAWSVDLPARSIATARIPDAIGAA